MTARALVAVVLAALAAAGCGLKGPLYLPEKSGVVVRPGPKAAPPAAEPKPAAPGQEPTAPATPTQPEPLPTPKTGPDRG